MIGWALDPLILNLKLLNCFNKQFMTKVTVVAGSKWDMGEILAFLA